MYALNKIITTNFVKVKNKTIFEISDNNLNDNCTVKVTTDNAPLIQVNEINYYMDFMIKCGDIYDNGTFMKCSHDGSSTEQEMTFQNCYYNDCVDELSVLALKRSDLNLEDFKNYLKSANFPIYMIKGMGYNVQGVNQIELTDNKLNELRTNAIKNNIIKYANEFASRNGYKLKTITIDVEKMV